MPSKDEMMALAVRLDTFDRRLVAIIANEGGLSTNGQAIAVALLATTNSPLFARCAQVFRALAQVQP